MPRGYEKDQPGPEKIELFLNSQCPEMRCKMSVGFCDIDQDIVHVPEKITKMLPYFRRAHGQQYEKQQIYIVSRKNAQRAAYQKGNANLPFGESFIQRFFFRIQQNTRDEIAAQHKEKRDKYAEVVVPAKIHQ